MVMWLWIIGFIVLYVVVALLFDRFGSDRAPLDRRAHSDDTMLADSAHSGLPPSTGVVDTSRNK